MQANVPRIEATHLPPEHHLSPRRTRTTAPSAGFFTLGFAVAVLAGGLLFAGAMGELPVAKSVSAPTRSKLAGEPAQPAGNVKTESARSVVIGEAPSESLNQARASGSAMSVR